MATNPSANEDILYKCTIDEIRLRVTSDLQENHKKRMNIHELLCMASMEEARLEFNFGQLWLNWGESRKLVIVNSW